MRNPGNEGNLNPPDVAACLALLALSLIWVGDPATQGSCEQAP